MYLFLQNFRATLIPTIAVPVVLLEYLRGATRLNFSINTLTMFAMVLAVACWWTMPSWWSKRRAHRQARRAFCTTRQATRKSMGQIQGALVGIAVI